MRGTTDTTLKMYLFPVTQSILVYIPENQHSAFWAIIKLPEVYFYYTLQDL